MEEGNMRFMVALIGIVSFILGANTTVCELSGAMGWFIISALSVICYVFISVEEEEAENAAHLKEKATADVENENRKFARLLLFVLGMAIIVIAANGCYLRIPFSEWGIAVGIVIIEGRRLIPKPSKRK